MANAATWHQDSPAPPIALVVASSFVGIESSDAGTPQRVSLYNNVDYYRSQCATSIIIDAMAESLIPSAPA